MGIDWLGLRSNLRLGVSRAAFLGTILLVVGAAGVAQEKPRVVHVFVALADNDHQGIVPVPMSRGIYIGVPRLGCERFSEEASSGKRWRAGRIRRRSCCNVWSFTARLGMCI